MTDDDLDDDLDDDDPNDDEWNGPDLEEPEFDKTPRYVLLPVLHESECDGAFQEDSWDDALTEEQMLEMLAQKLGYDLIKRGA